MCIRDRLNSYLKNRPYEMFERNGVLYFVADNGNPNTYEYDVWRSEGTLASTYPITAFHKVSMVNAQNPIYLTKVGGSIYFLSLIHISEPTRQAEISYAVFC